MPVEFYIVSVAFRNFRGEPDYVVLLCDDYSQEGNFWLPIGPLADPAEIWDEICEWCHYPQVEAFVWAVEEAGAVVIDGHDFHFDPDTDELRAGHGQRQHESEE